MFGKKKKEDRSITAKREAILSEESPFAFVEAYKTLRANLRYIVSTMEKCKRVVVTSSLPDEGKSVFAINLATTLAEGGAKVLLIDADMRNPSVHRLLRVKSDHKKGLSAVLTGEEELKECVFLHPQKRFYFMMTGEIPPNPNELLGSNNMEKLLASVESNFDYVICDTPPVGIISDAAVLSQHCDGVLFVVRQNHTRRSVVHAALKTLKNVNAHVIGTVLTRCDPKDLEHKYGHKKNYYYSGYYYGKDRSPETDE